MSISPINGRETLRLAVEKNPSAWQNGIKDLDIKIRGASGNLNLMRQPGGVEIAYYENNHTFGKFYTFNKITLQQEMDIVKIHREFLLQEFVKKAMTGESEENIKAVSEWMLSKLNYPASHPKHTSPNNIDFITNRFDKVYKKLEKGQIKTVETKEKDKKNKVIERLTTEKAVLEADLVVLSSPKALNSKIPLDLDTIYKSLNDLPKHTEAVNGRITKINNLIAILRGEKLTNNTLTELQIDKDTVHGLPSISSDQRELDDFIRSLQTFIKITEETRMERERKERRLEEVKREISVLVPPPPPATPVHTPSTHPVKQSQHVAKSVRSTPARPPKRGFMALLQSIAAWIQNFFAKIFKRSQHA